MATSEREAPARVSNRFFLHRAVDREQQSSFAEDVRRGLCATPKRLAPKYFYDALGSALFEAICELPEYYLTRAEFEILEQHAPAMVAALGGPVELIEFGSGSARKTRTLIEAVLAVQPHLEYRPIDISPSALLTAAAGLVARYDGLTVSAYADDYFEVLRCGRLRTERRVLALFLGSNVGNYEPAGASALLAAMAASFKPRDGLLLGYDVKKDIATLERAYNDPTGVTAAFDKNLLGRINRELGGRFDLDGFRHEARYDVGRGSVDSFLVAERGMRVPIEALGCDVRLAPFESIHTESSYKFDAAGIAQLAERSGLYVAQTWHDAARRFAVSLLVIR